MKQCEILKVKAKEHGENGDTNELAGIHFMESVSSVKLLLLCVKISASKLYYLIIFTLFTVLYV